MAKKASQAALLLLPLCELIYPIHPLGGSKLLSRLLPGHADHYRDLHRGNGSNHFVSLSLQPAQVAGGDFIEPGHESGQFWHWMDITGIENPCCQ